MGKSLMIVDDSSTMRKIIMRTVRSSGVEFDSIEEAGNGEETIEKLSSDAADVILCDVNMPQMSGLEMLKKVRQEIPACNDSKIIMVTTESGADTIDGAMADGANGYITKPFTPEKFQEILTPLL